MKREAKMSDPSNPSTPAEPVPPTGASTPVGLTPPAPADTNLSSPGTDQTKQLDDQFMFQLYSVLTQIVRRFPDNRTATSLLNSFRLMESFKSEIRSGWRDMSTGSIESIMKRDPAQVALIMQKHPYPQVRDLGIDKYLVDPAVEEATKDSLWRYLQVLTMLSRGDEEQGAGAAAPVAFQPVQPPQVRAAPPHKPPDLKQNLETFVHAMPEIMKTVNKMLQDDDGTNVLAQLAKQIANPNQAQTGVAGNLAANLFEQKNDPETVMQQVQEELGGDLDSAEIIRRLKKLERIEQRAKKSKK
jgi:hypothetical protein